MTDFINIYTGSDVRKSKTNLTNSHPSFSLNSNIFKICENYFLKIFCEEMIDLLNDEEHFEKILEFLTEHKSKYY
jgi:5'-3' exonuclease